MSSSGVPDHCILHISDTQLLTGDGMGGWTDVGEAVKSLLAELEAIPARPEAIVLTGTLPNRYPDHQYTSFRSAVERAAEREGVQVIWAMGNHSENAAHRSKSLDDDVRGGSGDEVYDVTGLRVITADSNIPGRLHGELDDAQLLWLRSVLAAPAPHGSILVLHHPPVPNPEPLMEMGELAGQTPLESVVAGTDIRTVLAGHLHYSASSTFAQVPVSVAAAACYTQDLGIDWDGTGGQVHLVHTTGSRIMHSTVRVSRNPL
ncbi:metallophosphoesterase family protein [Rhodococcus opacus]|uniref:metallophosphoesterase family protein n=1 Tax=Rhodococcus opacus TaxID=37919 RepID=UPI000A90EAC8|nr:metallophosphoesterase [Rhodococcus opacus]